MSMAALSSRNIRPLGRSTSSYNAPHVGGGLLLGMNRTSMANLLILTSFVANLGLFFQMMTMKNLLPDMDYFHHTLNLNSFASPRHPRTFKIEDLKNHVTLAHGTFYFGPSSHQVKADPIYQLSFNSDQLELLDDEIIDVQKEKERCARYKYKLIDEVNPKRRRLFLGALLGDDNMEVLRAVGTEAYNIFHTVSFVEGNTTFNLSPRKWRYLEEAGEKPSERLNTLRQLFGPKTKVSVEYYVSTLTELFGREKILFFENCQREGSSHRWTMNGMRPEDIGIISDADEVFTRDYLRAMQICDVPEFRPNQDCRKKQRASTVVFESSPGCLTKDRRWPHPDAIVGECVENVGNSSIHPPAKREYKDRHGAPTLGHGAHGNFSEYWSENDFKPESIYPLWMAADIRLEGWGVQKTRKDGSATGYHFHNFFSSAETIHVKYHTYGHSNHRALEKPMWELHNNLQLAVDCANGVYDRKAKFNLDYNASIVMPIYYLSHDATNRRHELWQNIVKEEEELWNSTHGNMVKT